MIMFYYLIYLYVLDHELNQISTFEEKVKMMKLLFQFKRNKYLPNDLMSC